MKILVCISKTPDTTAKIAFTDNNTKFAEAGVQWIINPYDEWYALVRAIELKEADPSTIIHLVTVGGADADPIIRKALALGGDEAVRINTEPVESYQVAAEIAEVAKGYDLILTGKETIDYNNGAVGGMLAELLDLPYVAQATDLQLNGTSATVKREMSIQQAIAHLRTTLKDSESANVVYVVDEKGKLVDDIPIRDKVWLSIDISDRGLMRQVED